MPDTRQDPPQPTASPRPTEPASPTKGPSNTPESGWELVWAVEFNLPDGAPIDTTRWTAMIGGHDCGNKEWQYYTNRVENAFHRQGNLVIRVIPNVAVGGI